MISQLASLHAHVGHLNFETNTDNKYYILGEFQNHQIINLQFTTILLKKALKFGEDVYLNHGYVLFLSTNIKKDHILNIFLQQMSSIYGFNTYTTSWTADF